VTQVEVKIGIPKEDREAEGAFMNGLLADLFLLYTKTRNFHWNVTGPHFWALHKMFESQYEMLDDEIDDLAERIRALGGFARATLTDYQHLAHLREDRSTTLSAREMLTELLDDHEAVIRELREEAAVCQDKHHDLGTSDFLTGLMEQHEKTAWMLRATLEGVA